LKVGKFSSKFFSCSAFTLTSWEAWNKSRKKLVT